MSVDDAIKRLKTESRSIIEAREQQGKGQGDHCRQKRYKY